MRPLTLCVTVAAIACVAAPAAAKETSKDWSQLSNEGIAHFKAGRYDRARASLEAAIATKEGRAHFATVYRLAKTYYELTEIERAFEQAGAAAKLAGEGKDAERANALVDALSKQFAPVNVEQDASQAADLAEGIIRLEDVGGLINKTKKEQFRKIQARFAATPLKLPQRIYLPPGRYKANGAQFDIEVGQTAHAQVFLYNRAGDGNGSLSPWWYVGGGAVVAAGIVAGLAAGGVFSGDDRVHVSVTGL